MLEGRGGAGDGGYEDRGDFGGQSFGGASGGGGGSFGGQQRPKKVGDGPKESFNADLDDEIPF